MKHFRIDDKEGGSCFVIPEEEYIALTHYFGKTTIDVLKYMKKIGKMNWDMLKNLLINYLINRRE